MTTEAKPNIVQSPSQESFAAFRKRVSADKTLAGPIKSIVAETNANADLLAAITKAVGAIDAS